MALAAFAAAKVNLFLHVGPRAADGYHPICSLMVFADVGDRLALTLSGPPRLRIGGPFGGGLGDGDDNLVNRARHLILAAAETRYAGQLEVNPLGITDYIALNTRLPPFDDLRARQALNFAVDRQRLTALTAGQSLGVVTCQVLPPNFDGYRRTCPYTADPNRAGTWTAPDLARARKLVRLSGTAGEAVTFWIPRWINFGAASGRYVVSVLDSLGYRARFRFAPDPYVVEDKLRVQAGFGAWYADFATPAGFIGSYNKADLANNTNDAEFCDPAIDREIERAELLQTSAPEAASRLWAKVDSDLVDQAPWVPFANGDVVELVSSRVGNYQFNPQWLTLLDQLWVR